jgi:hypothetical protein
MLDFFKGVALMQMKLSFGRKLVKKNYAPSFESQD